MAFRRFQNLFRKHPLLANSLVYGSLYVGAEFSQQLITRKILVTPDEAKPIDIASLGRYLVVGSLINSNYLYVWYRWLDSRYVGTSAKVITKKLFLDQFVMTPPLYVIFYVSMSIMEGRDSLLTELREKFVKTFSISCLFWIPTQTVSFMFLPSAARVTYLGVCSIVWVNILCWIKRCQNRQLNSINPLTHSE